MKTRNDILAEYVRKKYPEIERTLDFAVYSISESLKGIGVALRTYAPYREKVYFILQE